MTDTRPTRLEIIRERTKEIALAVIALAMLAVSAPAFSEDKPVFVGPHNFVRAETNRYMESLVNRASHGEVYSRREPTDLASQHVIRMNLDTLYSMGVFDMEAGPVTITVPTAPDGRYVSAQVLNQDHLTAKVFYSGTHTFTAKDVGTRYAAVLVRVFANAVDQDDISYANEVQDMIETSQPSMGEFTVPEYDDESFDETRKLLLRLAALARGNFGVKMGTADEIDPVSHLIITAVGWGLLPESAADYFGGQPEPGNKDIPHELILKDVPVKGFWSVTVYNKRGFMVPNELGVNALNNVNATKSADGSYRIQLGGCKADTVNCIPTPENWNYTLRTYQPGEEILSGKWKAPAIKPIK